MGKDITYYQGSYFAQERDRIANQLRNSPPRRTPRQPPQAVWYQAFINTAEHVAILTQAEQGGGPGLRGRGGQGAAQLSRLPGRQRQVQRDTVCGHLRRRTAKPRASSRGRACMTNIFVSDICNGVKTGAKESDFIKAMAKPERSFTFVSLSVLQLPRAKRCASTGRPTSRKFLQDQAEQDPRQVRRVPGERDPQEDPRQDQHLRGARQDVFQGRVRRQGRRHGLALRLRRGGRLREPRTPRRRSSP